MGFNVNNFAPSEPTFPSLRVLSHRDGYLIVGRPTRHHVFTGGGVVATNDCLDPCWWCATEDASLEVIRRIAAGEHAAPFGERWVSCPGLGVRVDDIYASAPVSEAGILQMRDYMPFRPWISAEIDRLAALNPKSKGTP